MSKGSRDHKGGNNLVTIPNTPFRSGDFSGAPTIIYDPDTGTADGRNRTPFPQQQSQPHQSEQMGLRLFF